MSIDLVELDGMPEQLDYVSSQRKSAGGRHHDDENHPDIDVQFLEVLKEHSAGDPMDDQVIWMDLTPNGIGGLLEEHHRAQVSIIVARKLLRKQNYQLRKVNKKQTLKSVTHRELVRYKWTFSRLQKPEHGAQVDRSEPHSLTGAWRTPKPG